MMMKRPLLAFILLCCAHQLTRAHAYIHFPPMSLEKMCRDSKFIRIINITKFDREKGVVIFEPVELLKGEKPAIQSFKTLLKPDADNATAILDWLAQDKQAVLFTLESPDPNATLACGYVFIDDLCFSVDYNTHGQFWQMLRVEPPLAACYKGPVADLIPKVKALLQDKSTTRPATQPARYDQIDPKAFETRRKEIDQALKSNRNSQAG